MKIEVIICIVFLHWFGDFVLQTHHQAHNKSKHWHPLITHTFIYSCIFLVAGVFYLGSAAGAAFAAVTFVAHTATDYFTSRLNKKLWDKKDVHNFFVSVGFDQFLHYAQLFITFHILTHHT